RAVGSDRAPRGEAGPDVLSRAKLQDRPIRDGEARVHDDQAVGTRGDDGSAQNEEIDVAHARVATGARAAPCKCGRTSRAKRSICSMACSRTMPGKCGKIEMYSSPSARCIEAMSSPTSPAVPTSQAPCAIDSVRLGIRP